MIFSEREEARAGRNSHCDRRRFSTGKAGQGKSSFTKVEQAVLAVFPSQIFFL
jgi:hypothetical protein